MKKIDLIQSVTLMANLGVIVGIIFLVFELRQSQSFAETQMFLALDANSIEVGNAISSHADIWIRGNSGAVLDAGETAIYRRLLLNLNNGYWTTVMGVPAAGLYEQDPADAAEFALFLYQNPGALEVWQSREEDLATFRGILNPDNQDAQEWMDFIMTAIERFEESESTRGVPDRE
jgi:hypothetical protein